MDRPAFVAPAPSHPVPSTTTGSASVPAIGSPSDSVPLTDAERLDVYRIALEFQVLASTLVPNGHAGLRDQLERASLSVVLLIAEGTGRRSRRDKRRFYSMARGSAMECAAAIDIIYMRRLASADDCRRAKTLAVRIIQMISKLERRMGA